jgi:uncharacterized membrane protein YkvA (DUF1232 family)
MDVIIVIGFLYDPGTFYTKTSEIWHLEPGSIKGLEECMQKRPSRDIVPARGGVFKEVVMRIKLILRLMGDRRVSPLVKLIPIGTLAYWLWPIDLIAGIPGLSALDDIAVLGLGTYMFIELCPPEVVREHTKQLMSNNEIVDEAQDSEDQIVDGEATDVSDRK